MTTEIRFEDEELDVRAYVDDVGAVNLVLRHDDGAERDRSYVSLSGPPAEIRATLARLLGVTNAVARSLEELAALELEDDRPGIVDTGEDWTAEERAAALAERDEPTDHVEGPRNAAGVAIMRGDEPR